MQVKVCSRCRQEKPVSEFYKHKSEKDGLHRECKACMRVQSKKWHTENKEKHAAQVKTWNERNPEKYKEFRGKAVAKYYANHKSEIIRKNTEYRKKHKEEHDAWMKKYMAEYFPKWMAEHPENLHEARQRRRARVLNADGCFSADEWVALCEKYHSRCLSCGRDDVPMSPDHIVPLSLGGSNSIDNIQPLCVSCNKKKHTKIIDYRNSVYATM